MSLIIIIGRNQQRKRVDAECSDPMRYFLWSHSSVGNRSLVDFKQMNEAYDDDLHENGWFIPKR